MSQERDLESGVGLADQLAGMPAPNVNRVLVGHRTVADRICGLYTAGRLHHAWLLRGQRGIGKATLAFRLASHILRHSDPAQAPPTMTQSTDNDPVDRQLASGAQPNCLYLSRPWQQREKRFKTELTVAQIQRANKFFHATAAGDAWRVCIVDSVDDMNRNAANALLKLLEEPPRRSVFFLINHRAGQSIATLRSRCQFANLQPLDAKELVEALAAIGLDAGPDAARIADLADGSVRRAAQLIAGESLSLNDELTKLLGTLRGKPDWAGLHGFADKVAARGKNDLYQLSLDLALADLHRDVRLNASKNTTTGEAQQQRKRLARLAGLWEKTSEAARVVESYNLDRKQLILEFFHDYREAISVSNDKAPGKSGDATR